MDKLINKNTNVNNSTPREIPNSFTYSNICFGFLRSTEILKSGLHVSNLNWPSGVFLYMSDGNVFLNTNLYSYNELFKDNFIFSNSWTKHPRILKSSKISILPSKDFAYNNYNDISTLLSSHLRSLRIDSVLDDDVFFTNDEFNQDSIAEMLANINELEFKDTY